jgi:hypothetical protein
VKNNARKRKQSKAKLRKAEKNALAESNTLLGTLEEGEDTRGGEEQLTTEMDVEVA